MPAKQQALQFAEPLRNECVNRLLHRAVQPHCTELVFHLWAQQPSQCFLHALQDPGFNAEPLTPRPAAAIDWGSAAPPPSKPAPAPAAPGAGVAPSQPLRSSAASSYADLSDRYLDRPQPAAARLDGVSAASSPQPQPHQPQPAHLGSDSGQGAATAAVAQGRSAETASSSAVGESTGGPPGALAASSALARGLLPAPPEAASRPPLWSDASSSTPRDRHQQVG